MSRSVSDGVHWRFTTCRIVCAPSLRKPFKVFPATHKGEGKLPCLLPKLPLRCHFSLIISLLSQLPLSSLSFVFPSFTNF